MLLQWKFTGLKWRWWREAISSLISFNFPVHNNNNVMYFAARNPLPGHPLRFSWYLTFTHQPTTPNHKDNQSTNRHHTTVNFFLSHVLFFSVSQSYGRTSHHFFRIFLEIFIFVVRMITMMTALTEEAKVQK